MKELIECNTKLKTYANFLTKDYDKAADLLQETNLKILMTKGRYPLSDTFQIAVTIMRNTFLNDVKFDKRFTKEIPDHATSYTQVDELSHKHILRVVDSLNHDLKRSFQLYLDGYKYHEIADLEKIPLGTVQSRIYLARQQLKSLLKAS